MMGSGKSMALIDIPLLSALLYTALTSRGNADRRIFIQLLHNRQETGSSII